MRALFVVNQRKTEFYHPVARRMAERGVEIYWISLSARWTDYLVRAGWPASHILSMERFGPEWSGAFAPTREDWDRAARIEAADEAGFKNTLIMDRELNKLPGQAAEAYLHVVTREIERFVVENEIAFGFGEDTWAPEIATGAVMRALGRQYYIPHSIRLPSNRFGFFRTVFHDQLEDVGPVTAEHRAIARTAVEGLRSRQERPFYFDRNKNPQRFRSHWVEEARLALTNRAANAFDHTVPSLTHRAVRRLEARFHIKRANRAFERMPPAPSRPYVLIPLQKQPESSVDVYGKGLSGQLEVTRALARVLPADWEIWIKEHPHAIGDRSSTYYRDLRRLPGVRLIHYNEDTMALIRRAGLVASVSGTACLEAGVLNVPAITFAPMFFGNVLLRNGIDPFGMTHQDMAALLREADQLRHGADRDRVVEDAIAQLVSRSFEGIIADPISAPESVEPGNIEQVANACLAVIDHRQRTAPVAVGGPSARTPKAVAASPPAPSRAAPALSLMR